MNPLRMQNKLYKKQISHIFLRRDISGLGSKVYSETLGHFWRMLGQYHGQIWNATELGRSMYMRVTAVNHYRDLLACTFMIQVLPP